MNNSFFGLKRLIGAREERKKGGRFILLLRQKLSIMGGKVFINYLIWLGRKVLIVVYLNILRSTTLCSM